MHLKFWLAATLSLLSAVAHAGNIDRQMEMLDPEERAHQVCVIKGDVSDAKRLKALEDENAKLKKLLVETILDNAILKDITSRKG